MLNAAREDLETITLKRAEESLGARASRESLALYYRRQILICLLSSDTSISLAFEESAVFLK